MSAQFLMSAFLQFFLLTDKISTTLRYPSTLVTEQVAQYHISPRGPGSLTTHNLTTVLQFHLPALSWSLTSISQSLRTSNNLSAYKSANISLPPSYVFLGCAIFVTDPCNSRESAL